MSGRLLFTGGGSAGHVTPNVTLIEHYQARGWQVRYLGSGAALERRILEPLRIPYHAVATGKLRRYFSWRNFIAPFLLLLGLLQSLALLLARRPRLVFSKGGFVAVPVVTAAWLLRIPVVTHESDVTPGLATRLMAPLATRICLSFAETAARLSGPKVSVTGSPVRELIRRGDAARGRAFLGLAEQARPLLLVFGGSLGARSLNQAVREALPALLAHFDVVHVCGPGKLPETLGGTGVYLPFEYVGDEFGDLLAAADLAVSRAGANSLYELLFRRLPHLLVPLPKTASRGDQLINARLFRDRGFSACLFEAELNGDSLLAGVLELQRQRRKYIDAMHAVAGADGTAAVLEVIDQVLEGGRG